MGKTRTKKTEMEKKVKRADRQKLRAGRWQGNSYFFAIYTTQPEVYITSWQRVI